ncbi:hypothetical protein [Pseudomonas asplenii]|uniref:hypothetical protein n=1 Tax=Pseudomonas asplenii TaxID=53407 RepID=UPI0006B5477A
MAEKLNDVIEHFYNQVKDECNPNHRVAMGWLAIPGKTMAQAERDNRRRKKAAALQEEDLRLKVRPGTKQALAEIKQWAEVEENGEAMILLIATPEYPARPARYARRQYGHHARCKTPGRDNASTANRATQAARVHGRSQIPELG